MTTNHTGAGALAPGQPVCDGDAGRRSRLGRLLDRRRAWVAERRYLQECSQYAAAVRWEFRDACEALRVCQWIDTPTGMFVRTPMVRHVTVGPPVTFTIELMPGQRCADIAEHGPRLAESLGGAGLRVEPLPGRFAKVTLLDRDPLADGFTLPAVSLDSAADFLLLGRDESATTLGHTPGEAVHIAVQGMTRSGKSSACYGWLSSLAAAPDVLVAGVDHTDLLLGRPWDGTAHRAWQSTGSAPEQIAAHAEHLEQLVATMRGRRDGMDRYSDKVTTGPGCPVIVCVLEEYPQLLDLADAQSGKANPLGQRIRMAVKAMVAEGGKYGLRVLMLAQRFEATAVGGGYVRDQFGLRISFSVPTDSLVMLHGDDAREHAGTHAVADKGIALVSGPGRPLTRMRVPYLGGYREYVQRIETTGRAA
jgi:S-DNA-T family DNA segregation ATPase FtsK/SpoIIIE